MKEEVDEEVEEEVKEKEVEVVEEQRKECV